MQATVYASFASLHVCASLLVYASLHVYAMYTQRVCKLEYVGTFACVCKLAMQTIMSK